MNTEQLDLVFTKCKSIFYTTYFNLKAKKMTSEMDAFPFFVWYCMDVLNYSSKDLEKYLSFKQDEIEALKRYADKRKFPYSVKKGLIDNAIKIHDFELRLKQAGLC
jgi:hypothetical protein